MVKKRLNYFIVMIMGEVHLTSPILKKIKNMGTLAAAIIGLITTVISTVVTVATSAAKTAKAKAALLNNRLAYMYAYRNA